MTRAAALVAALLATAARASAQAPVSSPSPSPARAPFTFEAEVQVVSVSAVVHDRQGRFLRGLSPQDVEVYEDGVRQELLYLREAGQGGEAPLPLSVVLVLDASGSMKDHLHFLQEAAVTFVHRLTEIDRALVIDFNSSVRTSVDFTGDLERLEQFVAGLQAWGGTSLYDATHTALNRIKDEPGRKAVIVFSDGADTTSSMKEQEVIDYARSVEASVYGIGFRTSSGPFARGPRGFLRKVAQDTGGAYFSPDRVGELVKVFNAISDELHNHYALAYVPRRPPDNSWRAITVKLRNHQDATVRVRKGYFALKRRRGGR